MSDREDELLDLTTFLITPNQHVSIKEIIEILSQF